MRRPATINVEKSRVGVFVAAASVALMAAVAAGAGTSFSGPPITINDATPGVGFLDPSIPSAATPYPSALTVSGQSTIAANSISITLDQFSHDSPDDVDILVQGPN